MRPSNFAMFVMLSLAETKSKPCARSFPDNHRPVLLQPSPGIRHPTRACRWMARGENLENPVSRQGPPAHRSVLLWFQQVQMMCNA